MARLSNLSPEQIRLMVTLDDGFDHIDSVGREIGDLRPVEVMDARALMRMGLVTADEGRGGQVWVRLTEKGRKGSSCLLTLLGLKWDARGMF